MRACVEQFLLFDGKNGQNIWEKKEKKFLLDTEY